MATSTITVESSATGVANAAATLTGDAIVAGVEEILQSTGIGMYQLFARPNEVNGSTFIFKLPERLIPELYSRATSTAKGKGPVVGQVAITTDQEFIVPVEFEDMEFATQVMADAEKARVTATMVSAINAHLDLEVLRELNKAAASVVVDFTGADSQDKLTVARLKLGKETAKLESALSPTELGVDQSRQLIILSPEAYYGYINSFDTNVQTLADEVKVGNMAISKINGTFVMKHPLVGRNNAVGDIATGAAALDLSKVEGFLLSDVSVAMPVNFVKTATRINSLFNQEIATKYKFGVGTLRDKLIVKLELPTT